MNTLHEKHRLRTFVVCCLFLAGLTARLSAADTYFSVAQYGSSYVEAIGDMAADNPSGLGGTPTYPAYTLEMPYFSPWGSCLFTATVDTSVAKGNYYIGYYSGGDAYLYVY